MKLNKDTMLAYVDGGTQEIVQVLATGKADVTELLAGSVRQAPAYGMEATHVTNTTRKYQCNAALAYMGPIAKLRKANGLETDGAAIRLILEAGLKKLGFGEIVAEVAAESEVE